MNIINNLFINICITLCIPLCITLCCCTTLPATPPITLHTCQSSPASAMPGHLPARPDGHAIRGIAAGRRWRVDVLRREAGTWGFGTPETGLAASQACRAAPRPARGIGASGQHMPGRPASRRHVLDRGLRIKGSVLDWLEAGCLGTQTCIAPGQHASWLLQAGSGSGSDCPRRSIRCNKLWHRRRHRCS